MYVPIFEKSNCKFIILDEYYTSLNADEALALGVIGQIDLSHLDYSFKGETRFVRDTTEYKNIKEIHPITGKKINLGLIDGEISDRDFISLPELFLKDDLFVTEIISMNEDTNLTIAIGMEEDTHKPYVLMIKNEETDALPPELARKIASELSFAAEASEMDSFLRKALDMAYDDDEMSKDKKRRLIDAIRNLREDQRREVMVNEEDYTQEESLVQNKESLEQENSKEEITRDFIEEELENKTSIGNNGGEE